MILIYVIASAFIATIIHEYAHMRVALWCKVSIETFSIGFGPRLAHRVSKKSGVDYQIALIPAGGYVSIPDMYQPEGVTHSDLDPYAKTQPFWSRPWWQKTAISAAGVSSNFIQAFIGCLILTGGTYGLKGLLIGPILFWQMLENLTTNLWGILATGYAAVFHRLDGTEPPAIQALAQQQTPTDIPMWAQFISMFVAINILLGLFNSIPLPFLDGGKILENTIYSVRNTWRTKHGKQPIRIHPSKIFMKIFIATTILMIASELLLLLADGVAWIRS